MDLSGSWSGGRVRCQSRLSLCSSPAANHCCLDGTWRLRLRDQYTLGELTFCMMVPIHRSSDPRYPCTRKKRTSSRSALQSERSHGEEDDEGDPKVKLYARDDGNFSGEALVVYFKEESVALAVAMLDEAELRIGDPSTVMSVSQAEFGHKAGEGASREMRDASGKPRREVDKRRATKRIGRMQKYVSLSHGFVFMGRP